MRSARGVHERFYGMDAEGRSAREISLALGVSARTVTRWRRATGRSHGTATAPTPPMLLRLAHDMLLDGASRAEAARSVGISVDVLKRHFPELSWTPEECREYGRMIRHTNIDFGTVAAQ